MKKFLVLLSTVLFPVLLNLAVCACKNIDNIIVSKVNFTKKNLETFFEENNVFNHQEEFFFKNADEQTEEETIRMTGERITNIFKSLLDQSLGQKIRSYFIYDASNYYFKINNLTHISKFEWNKVYKFKFQLEIIENNGSFYFKQDNLVLVFTETKQYDDAKWLKIYLKYLKSCCTFLWQEKYQGYEETGFLPYYPIIPANTKMKFNNNNNNNQTVLNFLSNYYTNLLSDTTDDNKTKSLWFYNDKQFRVIATKYQYLGNTPQIDLYKNGGVRAMVTLNFVSITNPTVMGTQEYEIWLPYE